jgi:hypothetical protein
MARRYCGMCDELVNGRECPKCGADTDAWPRAVHHTCHDMQPPFSGPCAACKREHADAQPAVDLMDALTKAFPKIWK